MSKSPQNRRNFRIGVNSTPERIRELERFFRSSEPTGVKPYIFVPQKDLPYATGTGVPLVGLIRSPNSSGGGVVLPAPDSARALPYIKSYITLDEYLGPGLKERGYDYDADELIPLLLKQHSRTDLLLQLAFLNDIADRPRLQNQLLAEFKLRMPRSWVSAFDSAMSRDGSARVFLARQPILRAMREAAINGSDVPSPSWPQVPVDTAVMLVHAVAGRLSASVKEQGDELWPTVSSGIAMEVIQNYLFHHTEDIWARLVRHDRLWQHYGENLKRYKSKLRANPSDLFREATGIDRRDFIAFGFSLWTRSNNWNPGPHDPASDLRMAPATIRACLDLLAGDLSQLSGDLSKHSSDWAMLPFETRPVLELPDGRVVILDQTLLLDRITNGLYWIVFDSESNRGKKEAELWSAAYSEMIEAYALDRVRAIAPTVPQGKTFYSEDEIGAAYAKRRCDAIVDFGDFALFEVQKGQVSLGTRQGASIDAFIKDTDQMVIQKAAQIDETAAALLDDERPLTGIALRPKPIFQPFIVLGATYPVNPITTEYIAQQIKAHGLLSDPRGRDLALIDLGELDMLEGMWERDKASPIEVVRNWKSSAGWRFSLRNYLLEHYRSGDPDQFRASWMKPVGDELFEDVIKRLGPVES
jgi:hypothetical protein